MAFGITMTVRKRRLGNDEKGQKRRIAEENDGKEMTRRDEARRKVKERCQGTENKTKGTKK